MECSGYIIIPLGMYFANERLSSFLLKCRFLSLHVAFCRIGGSWKHAIIAVTLFSWLDKTPILGILPTSLSAYPPKQPASSQ